MPASSISSLKDKVFLITGAAQGIGAAVAVGFAKQGATVILLDKVIPLLEKVYDKIIDAGGPQPAIYPMDLKGATLPDYTELADKIESELGRLDGLIHCAAELGQLAPVVHQDQQTWLETMHINLNAAYFVTHACLNLLRKQKHATLLFTTDSHKGKAYWSAYGISKAAIETLAMQLADELEVEGRVHVNCIDPGHVKTSLQSRAFPAIDFATLAEPEDVVGDYLFITNSDLHGQCLTLEDIHRQSPDTLSISD